MTRDDVAAFAAELTLTAELFAAPLSDGRITAYYQALEDVPWHDLREALMVARQCERWFPTPSVLRDLLEPPAEVMAATAFAQVWALAAGRSDRQVQQLEPAALEAVDAMGGWGTFREARTGTGSLLSAQFRKLYLAFARETRVAEARDRVLTGVRTPELEIGGAA